MISKKISQWDYEYPNREVLKKDILAQNYYVFLDQDEIIGGITIENCQPLISAGADFLAIVGGVWDHPEGEAAAIKAFNKAFENSI